MSGYAFFWGCTIPARFPFIEKSTRLVLDRLGIEYHDLDGFTCCPEKSLVKNMNDDLWRVSAARNLAVAERKGHDITMACTGCYSTLKSVHSYLSTYPVKKKWVNDKLKTINMELDSNISVKHLISVFLDDVGLTKIREKIVVPLKRMKIAVHGGCHLVRPSKSLRFDDPLKPQKYDQLIKGLGAVSLEYNTKMFCCGGSLDRVGQHENSLQMAAKKLSELRERGADAITVVCPECFKAYDNNQFLLQRKTGEVYNIPVLTLQELMGLAFGFSSEELGLTQHKIDTTPFVDKLGLKCKVSKV